MDLYCELFSNYSLKFNRLSRQDSYIFDFVTHIKTNQSLSLFIFFSLSNNSKELWIDYIITTTYRKPNQSKSNDAIILKLDMWQLYNVFGDFPSHDVTQRLHQIKQEDDISSVYTASEKSKKIFQSSFLKLYRSSPQIGLLWHEKKLHELFFWPLIKLFKR